MILFIRVHGSRSISCFGIIDVMQTHWKFSPLLYIDIFLSLYKKCNFFNKKMVDRNSGRARPVWDEALRCIHNYALCIHILCLIKLRKCFGGYFRKVPNTCRGWSLQRAGELLQLPGLPGPQAQGQVRPDQEDESGGKNLFYSIRTCFRFDPMGTGVAFISACLWYHRFAK